MLVEPKISHIRFRKYTVIWENDRFYEKTYIFRCFSPLNTNLDKYTLKKRSQLVFIKFVSSIENLFQEATHQVKYKDGLYS